MRNTKLFLIAAGALALSSATATAATVTTDLNLRRGPGTGYHVITSLPAGARVDVGRCTGRWCKVGWRGHSGYASAAYISTRARRVAVAGWRTAEAAPRNPEIPRIWGYGFKEQVKPWPIFGSVIAPGFSTSSGSLYPNDTRSPTLR